MIPGNFLEDNRQMEIGRTVEFDYNDVPTVRKFAQSDLRIRALMGPVGCVAGDTLILTEQGPRPIAELTRPVRVLSWNQRKHLFELALSGGAFPKGRDYLYRVATPQGVFAAAGHHRVLCADHTYRRIESLQVGDVLAGCAPGQIGIFASAGPGEFPVNVFGFDRTIEDSMARYAESARLYGQRLLQEADSGPARFLLQGGAQTLSLLPGGLVLVEHTDGQGGRSPERIHQGRYDDPKRTGGCPFPGGLHREDVAGRTSSPLSARIAETARRCGRFLQKFVSHQRAPISSSCSCSSSSSLSEWSIISIVREPVKRIFWDMQVCDTNNYVTVDGAVHHNSGKSSGCVIELVRRGHEQAPMADGIRRTRWAIVRNTYRQLEDTTIKTVHDWLPPDLYGEWNKTDHNYYITAFPGVHIEFMFRALDRPDQLANLLSLEITGAWLNEFREIPKVIFDVLDTRVGRYPPPREVQATWKGIIMDTNPPDEHNPYYKYFEKTRPSNAHLWKQPSGLSPHAENIKNLPRNYYKDLIKGKDEQFINVYAHGLYGYVVEGKPVYASSYNDNTHVSTTKLVPVKGLPLITGWDFGLNPSVVIGQITPTGRVLILKAISSDGMGLEKFLLNQVVPMIKQEFFGYRIIGFGDPAGTQRVQTDEKTCYDIFRENGFHDIESAPSNNLVARQRAVEAQLSRSVFGEQAVVIDPEQDLLRKALSSGYRFKLFPNGESSETPDKNFYSHIANAFEYFCMFLGDNKGRQEREEELRRQLARVPQYKRISGIAGY